MTGHSMAISLIAAGIAACASAGFFFLSRQVPHPQLLRLGTMTYDAIRESSGIAQSRQYPGVFWTHNDKGNAPVIFAITQNGDLIGEFRLTTKNADWEDITTDADGNIYLAMTGNNDGKRKEVEVARFDEPQPLPNTKRSKPNKIREMTTWRLRYPDKPFDAESLFIHDAHAYIISKEPDGRPAIIYRFPLASTQTTITLQRLQTLPVNTPVTAAAISHDASQLAVLSKGSLHVFPIDGDPTTAAKRPPARFPLPDLQFEGCCFTSDGILLTAESREIFLLPKSRYAN